MKQGKAALISTFVVGGGQIFSGRVATGIILAVIFYGSIYLVINLWTGSHPTFWTIVTAWVLVWFYNILDAFRGPNYEKPPCEKACPAGIAPWIYLNRIATKSNQRYQYIPFFETLGSICPAPCEDNCTRKGIDAPVAIRYLKYTVEMDKPTATERKRKEKVAVVGAGPCGLTAAYSLANKGYGVVVYEREKKPGGVPSILIPEFRLSKSLLDKEIESLLKVGIEMRCGVEIGKDVSIDELLKNYDVIFIATGAWKPVKLGIPGEDNGLIGLDILRRVKGGEVFDMGKVGVIGGGNTAFDVARSLRRMGNNVKIYYRRRIEDIPAEHENRIAAEEEGIEIIALTVPVGIVKNTVIMAKTKCEGRRSLEIIKGSEFDVKMDSIVMAIGQQPDTGFLSDYVKIDEYGCICVKNGSTCHPKIFSGGDAVLGSQTVAHAVGHGLNIAEKIDYIIRKIPAILWGLLKDVYYPDGLRMFDANKDNRIKIPHRLPAKRLCDFRQIEQRVSTKEFVQEANRCLTCPLRYRP